MAKYLLHRLLMMVPTLLGITIVSFLLINLVPGGPLEAKISQIRFSGASSGISAAMTDAQIEALKKQYGFDKPVYIRYLVWLKNIAALDFGSSFKYEQPVVEVIAERLPVTLQFGVVSLLLMYLLSIPLGIAKAVRDGSRFDVTSSLGMTIMYAIPPLILGILLRQFLANREFLDLFPVAELYSDNYQDLSFFGQIGDRISHFVLPLTCYVANNFMVLSLLMKNSLMEEIKLDYVRTARAKGLGERAVIYKHALRNALIPILTGLGSFLTLFFGGSIIIEQIFNLDGMGLLSFTAVLARDYNVIMALVFFQSVLSMVGRLVSDVTYMIVDPRIDFQ